MSDELEADPKFHLGQSGPRREAELMAEMLGKIRDLPPSRKSGLDATTRQQCLDVLTIIEGYIGEALAQTVYASECDDMLTVTVEHHASATIRDLIHAIKDLNDGVLDPLVEKTKTKKNAALTRRQRESDDVLSQTIRIISRSKNITINQAAQQLARNLNNRGYRRKGKTVKWDSLRRLIYPK